MRFIFYALVCIFSYNCLLSQDVANCGDYITIIPDKFTGSNIYMAIKSVELVDSADSSKRLPIQARLAGPKNEALVFGVTAAKLNCFDKGDKTYIICEPDIKIMLINNVAFNCKGEFYHFLGRQWATKKEKDILLSKRIKAIRVTSQSGLSISI